MFFNIVIIMRFLSFFLHVLCFVVVVVLLLLLLNVSEELDAAYDGVTSKRQSRLAHGKD